jgi:NADH dehydrogenase FAD-containing subunit
MEVLGKSVSDRVAELLAESGVELEAGVAPVRFDQGRLVCERSTDVRADEVVALPGLSVPEVPGIPQGRYGFIGCDAEMRVDGLDLVWAAGDSTWFPIKQGGLAAQQAEVAAAGILRAGGADTEVPPFRPILRGALITGGQPQFIRAPAGFQLIPHALWVFPGAQLTLGDKPIAVQNLFKTAFIRSSRAGMIPTLFRSLLLVSTVRLLSREAPCRRYASAPTHCPIR